ncbi:MAG: fibronectin type III domain-containing protein [Myxococcales bacterium]|nr:fibronectin type III domain-containing protein [Myxococcales bacterium]
MTCANVLQQLRIPRSPWAALVLAFVLVALPTSKAAAASQDPLVAQSGGAVRFRAHPKLPWKNAAVPSRLKVGSFVECEHGCQIVFSGGTATLDPGASILVEGPRFLRFPADEEATRCDALSVIDGAVRLNRPEGSAGPLVVTTTGEHRLAIHEGATEVRLLAGRTVIAVESGRTLLARGPLWEEVSSSRIVEISPSGVLSHRSRAAAPRWDLQSPHHRPIGIATETPEADVAVSWSTPADATTQELTVARDKGFAQVVARVRVPLDRHHATVALREGTYYAHVKATDRDGTWSPPSPPATLRVARIALPESGFVTAGGTIVIAEGTSLRLIGTQGLEAAIGNGNMLPARRDIVVPGQDPQWLRLRLAGEAASESRYLVEKRELRAEVTLGPKAPVWPVEMVEARVRLRDPSGRVDPTKVRPRFTVTVGQREVDAHFTYNGDVWHARIHGKPIRGPQLLQLVVDDGAGHVLGKGYLEVVGSGG